MGFFKSLLKIIAIIIVIIAIIFLIYAALIAIAGGAIAGSAAILGTALGSSAWAFLLVGIGLLAIASIISPEGFSEAMERVGKGGAAVGGAIGDVIGGAVDGLVRGIGLPTLALAVGAFVILRRNRTADAPLQKTGESGARKKEGTPSDLRVTAPKRKTSLGDTKEYRSVGPSMSFSSRNVL